jgi:hypothetical protein
MTKQKLAAEAQNVQPAKIRSRFRTNLFDLFWAEAGAELRKAFGYAQDSQQSIWEFAIPLGELCRYDLTESDYRLLVSCGYLKHAVEVTRSDDPCRRFIHTQNLSFSDRSCFVLGESCIPSMLGAKEYRSRSDPHCEAPSLHQTADTSSLIPHWNSSLRILTIKEQIVLQYRWPAPNQERILAAFEEDNWPRHVDDPLPPKDGLDSQSRLHDAIKCLNRNQKQRLLRFRGDGTGKGILWEFAEL